jgi:hypothetical protein
LSFWDSNCSGHGLSGLVSAAVGGIVVRPAAGAVAFSAMCSPGGGVALLHEWLSFAVAVG